MKPDIVWEHRCTSCDWQPDPNARAGVETQATRHMKEAGHGCTVSRGRLPAQIEADEAAGVAWNPGG